MTLLTSLWATIDMATGTIAGIAAEIPMADWGLLWAVAHTLLGSWLFLA